METFLNFLWVLIAAVALGIWRTRWQREAPDDAPREALREWTAIGCALVLLFFAVSLTDDLHSEAILWDGFTTTRSHAAWCSQSAHNENAAHAAMPAVLASLNGTQKFQVAGQAITFLRCDPCCSWRDEVSGRAPPESCL